MSSEPKIRIMLVDDSAVIRGFLARFFAEDSEIEIVASVTNGQQAIDAFKRYDPIDVVILDIEMPVMDGITALPEILKVSPHTQVIMASTLTQKNAAVTFKALSIGASECLAKPTSTGEMTTTSFFKVELLEKTRSLGRVAQTKRGALAPVPKPAVATSVSQSQQSSQVHPSQSSVASARSVYKGPFRAVGIGSSTGGPQALVKVLGDLANTKDHRNYPIFITQHMPPTFTKTLADNIQDKTGIPCVEAEDGMSVANGHAYVAPGDYHMHVVKGAGGMTIRLSQDPPENYCRPAVDVMYRSLIEVYGNQFLSVILTGMGSDGLKGAQTLTEKQGVVIAQDEQTSVVWGMPGAVSEAGICYDILPLERIGEKINMIMNKGV